MRRPLADKRPLGPFAQSTDDEADGLKYYDRKVAPLVVIRDFHEDVKNGVEEMRYVAHWGSFHYTLTGSPLSTISAELGFHESKIENDFSLSPISNPGASGTMRQGTKLTELGGPPAAFAKAMKNIYGRQEVMFDFAELDAASQGHEFLADYEFTYELLMLESEVTSVDIDSQLS